MSRTCARNWPNSSVKVTSYEEHSLFCRGRLLEILANPTYRYDRYLVTNIVEFSHSHLAVHISSKWSSVIVVLDQISSVSLVSNELSITPRQQSRRNIEYAREDFNGSKEETEIISFLDSFSHGITNELPGCLVVEMKLTLSSCQFFKSSTNETDENEEIDEVMLVIADSSGDCTFWVYRNHWRVMQPGLATTHNWAYGGVVSVKVAPHRHQSENKQNKKTSVLFLNYDSLQQSMVWVERVESCSKPFVDGLFDVTSIQDTVMMCTLAVESAGSIDISHAISVQELCNSCVTAVHQVLFGVWFVTDVNEVFYYDTITGRVYALSQSSGLLPRSDQQSKVLFAVVPNDVIDKRVRGVLELADIPPPPTLILCCDATIWVVRFQDFALTVHSSFSFAHIIASFSSKTTVLFGQRRASNTAVQVSEKESSSCTDKPLALYVVACDEQDTSYILNVHFSTKILIVKLLLSAGLQSDGMTACDTPGIRRNIIYQLIDDAPPPHLQVVHAYHIVEYPPKVVAALSRAMKKSAERITADSIPPIYMPKFNMFVPQLNEPWDFRAFEEEGDSLCVISYAHVVVCLDVDKRFLRTIGGAEGISVNESALFAPSRGQVGLFFIFMKPCKKFIFFAVLYMSGGRYGLNSANRGFGGRPLQVLHFYIVILY
jgi:hypothetical protein